MMPPVPPKASRGPLQPRVLGTVGSAPQCPPAGHDGVRPLPQDRRRSPWAPGPPLGDVDVALENQPLSVFRR